MMNELRRSEGLLGRVGVVTSPVILMLQADVTPVICSDAPGLHYNAESHKSFGSGS